MPVTSLKLSDELKARVQKLVEGRPTSAHAFMVEAIERAAQNEELRRRFGDDAASAEAEAIASDRAFDAREAFAFFEARVSGGKPPRPRPKSWRKSG